MKLSKLPTVKPKKLIKLVLALGYVDATRAGGSHRKYVKPTSSGAYNPIIIPYHSNKDIPKGTMRAILRDFSENEKMTEEEIIKLLVEA